MNFRKKPVIIEAVQWTGENFKKIQEFCPSIIDMGYGGENSWPLSIPTLEGNMVAQRGDYIIKGVKGEFYPCKPDIFEATYERADKKDSIVLARIQKGECPICGKELKSSIVIVNDDRYGKVKVCNTHKVAANGVRENE